MIDEIRKRLEAATAEPYACRYEICWTRGYDTIQKIGNVVGGKDVDLNIITSDHSFIAHALTDIACLLERVEKLEAVRKAAIGLLWALDNPDKAKGPVMADLGGPDPLHLVDQMWLLRGRVDKALAACEEKQNETH